MVKRTQSPVCTFRCSIAPIDSAIKRSGDGNGMRLVIDIPESDIPDALPLLALIRQPLVIQVAIDTEKPIVAPNRATIE